MYSWIDRFTVARLSAVAAAPAVAGAPVETPTSSEVAARMVNLRTKTLDFRGFDSSIVLILRGGIPRPMGNFPECLSQGQSQRFWHQRIFAWEILGSVETCCHRDSAAHLLGQITQIPNLDRKWPSSVFRSAFLNEALMTNAASFVP